MEHNAPKTEFTLKDCSSDTLTAPVNLSILNYYKKCGRKRDLEQYFSLSTAQSEIKDPTSSFWKGLKMQSDSSDSEEKSINKSTELCRISIRCSAPDSSSSQDEKKISNEESQSPPIITEYVEPNDQRSDQGDHKSDNESQKSMDMTLDTSTNKPPSPTSSINSQRKLEWDSLADVGYANESDRKTSASSLSTIEKLALKQQYTNNDTKQDSVLEGPTAHSTPLDPNDSKQKSKKASKKATIFKKDVDQLAINLPMTSEVNQSQAINVNLTKHISFNVERNGGITFDNVTKKFVVEPHTTTEDAVPSHITTDKQIQTLKNTTEQCNTSSHKVIEKTNDKKLIPVMINLNSLKRKTRKKRIRKARKKINKKSVVKKKLTQPEKTGGQVSEAESFEYMPGHMYNQNFKNSKVDNAIGNKSSLESSCGLTTDSSKGSKFSFSKDLEKSVALLKTVFRQRYDDTNHKKKLIKEVVDRLLKSKYRDDESTTDFLTGLNFCDEKLDSEGHHTTTSTSDNNKTWNQTKFTRPRKSILRSEKNKLNPVASTSMSAPNLLSVSNSLPVSSSLGNPLLVLKNESEQSGKENSSSDNLFIKTSSEKLYQKYIEALQREQVYKKHLKEKEILLTKQVSRSTKEPLFNLKNNIKLKDIIKDLSRNNCDDGSGDASKLEGGTNSNIDIDSDLKKFRSHSVFTLSSCNSEISKKSNLKKRLQKEVKDFATAGCSKDNTNNQCCSSFHSTHANICMTDNSVQVDMKKNKDSNDENYILTTPENVPINKEPFLHIVEAISKTVPGAIKYVCLCEDKTLPKDMPQKIMLYKCSESDKAVSPNSKRVEVNTASVQCDNDYGNSTEKKRNEPGKLNQKENNKDSKTLNASSSCSDYIPLKRVCKSSQTQLNLALHMLQKNTDDKSTCSWSSEDKKFRVLSIERHLSDSVLLAGNESTGDDNLVITESTRWMQTEISIDPKISNPSLSDINIINQSKCAQLVSTSTRQVKLNLGSASDSCEANERKFSSHFEYSTEPTSVSKNVCRNEREQQTHIQCQSSKSHDNDNINRNVVENTENFVIPIKGTNMTLMVKLGQKSTGTNNSPYDVKGAMQDNKECCKGVQSETTDIFDQLKVRKSNDECNIIDHNSNQININGINKQNEYVCDKNINSNRCYGDGLKFNTYPITESDPKPKTKTRSNSDTHYLEGINFCKIPLLNVEKQFQAHNEFKDKFKNCARICSIKNIETQTSCRSSPRTKDNNTIGNIKDLAQCCTQTEEFKTNNDTENTLGRFGQSCRKIDKETQKNLVESNNDALKTSVYKNQVATKTCQASPRIEVQSQLQRQNTLCFSNTSSNSNSLPKKKLPIQREVSNFINVKCEYCLKNEEMTFETDTKREISNSCENCTCSVVNKQINKSKKRNISCNDHGSSQQSSSDSKDGVSSDPIMVMIKEITKRYSKSDIDKGKKKRCFKEIMTVLRYLLDTANGDSKTDSSETYDCGSDSKSAPKQGPSKDNACQPRKLVDVGVGSSCARKPNLTQIVLESTDTFGSSELPLTSDSATCKAINKIKNECEKYQKRKYCHSPSRNCDKSSSTSVHCERCDRTHHCSCRGHKCKNQRPKSSVEKIKKKCVAYNLIVQTSDSFVNESCRNNNKKLKNIVVKVPSNRKHLEKLPFKEVEAKIVKESSYGKSCRSRSLPNDSDVSSCEGRARGTNTCTVKDYLEQNRPDFIDQCGKRQKCLKLINKTRANERATQREMLSLQLERLSAVTSVSESDLRRFANQLGADLRRTNVAPKFISEQEMKKHSQRIYNSLPEVVKKKEDVKKENVKKTNLLLANIFKKNLQKKTLRGSVNLSNYNTVIKI